MRRYRNTKIVATLGPASSTPEVIQSLFNAGADVFRINFSHGTYEDYQKYVTIIRELEHQANRPIGILMDLQGPKLRLGTFNPIKVKLSEGQNFRLDLDSTPGSKDRVYLPHPEIFKTLVPGTDLLLDDGRLRLRVTNCSPEFIETTVITGGEISNHKGLNIPGVMLPLSSLTQKDRKDLEFGLTLGIDWLGLSFVQHPQDIEEARSLVCGKARILSKLEKPMAIDHLEEIIALSDAIMVARGDLGVELPPEDIPSIQKRIIRSCRQMGKPVIVATQMLDSMVYSPSPTRAEASDVATAVYDGVDAVMLSAESASGQYPVEAVEMMSRIISRVEHDPIYLQMMDASRTEPKPTVADAITAAARQVAHIIPIKAIVTFTNSGTTTLRAAKERPESPILALTPSILTARMLSIVWGTHSTLTETVLSFSHMVNTGCQAAYEQQFAKDGEQIVVIAGVPFGTSGATNILRIAQIEIDNSVKLS